MHTKRPYRIPLYILAATMLLSWESCVKNPVTGRRQLSLISTQQEIAMGKESNPQILAEYGKVDDPALQEYFSGIGKKMAALTERPDLPWTFTVVDSPVVNAFAVPGGFIYSTRGILAYMNNEAELAGVLGHEIGHVTARHSVNQISKQELFGLGIGLGSVFSDTFSRFGGLAQTGVGILMLKYSRNDESQADQLGVRYMAEAGYDPSQMSDFFKVFKSLQEESGGSLPNWLSSHPAPPNRIEATAEAAAEIKKEHPQKKYSIDRNEFLSRIDGIAYGDNPREGYVEGNYFYHPDLRFQIEFPKGWKVQNTKGSVAFAEPGGNAALELRLVPSNEPQTPEAVADRIALQDNIQRLDGSSLSINGNPAYLGRYRLQADSGPVDVLAAFIDYRENLYQLAGMSPASAYSRYGNSFQNIIRSFRALNDSGKLSVQPNRVTIHRVRSGDTLRKLWQSQPHPEKISVEDLSILNRIDPDASLSQGTRIKLIRPGR